MVIYFRDALVLVAAGVVAGGEVVTGADGAVVADGGVELVVEVFVALGRHVEVYKSHTRSIFGQGGKELYMEL